MASETGDFYIEDEDTQEDEAHDTEQPPPLSSVILAIETANCMREKVAIERINTLPSREMVIQKICKHANLNPDDLNEVHQPEDARGLFYECRCMVNGIHLTYVYIAKTYEEPTYARFGDNVRVPLAHPGSTSILKVRVNGTTEAVGRWKD